MSELRRSHLFAKLNPAGYRALEAATASCRLAGNPYVEVGHLLRELVQQPGGDVGGLMSHLRCDRPRILQELADSLRRLPGGAPAIIDFSPELDECVERAWLLASLHHGEQQIRTGHLVLALLKTPGLRHICEGCSRTFAAIRPEQVEASFAAATRESSERTADRQPVGRSQDILPLEAKDGPLSQYATDLTAKARNGELDPVTGRDREIRQCIDILLRRRQNNPLLVGDAGVGKTAIVEGIALRIAARAVPPALEGVRLLALDLGQLAAGAGQRGEFEQRLRDVIDAVQGSPDPIILFIDEVHMLIGAGGAEGTGDAANLLKPALARGNLRTISATTWDEYKRHVEKDAALSRRFERLFVGEPSEEACLEMLHACVPAFERHHGVEILSEALEAAVRLSSRHIPARRLPDKAISLLDTACARVAVSRHAVPEPIEGARNRIQSLEAELALLLREEQAGVDHSARRSRIQVAIEQNRLQRDGLEERWGEELRLVREILARRTAVRDETAVGQRRERKPIAALQELQSELGRIQEGRPLVHPDVNASVVAEVVADWTGIPAGRMIGDEVDRVLKLDERLGQRVLGQKSALEAIARRIQVNRVRIDSPTRPAGVFLLCGPSGTGKTETALALAEALLGDERQLVSIQLGEFQEAHTVSTLKGAPPGYVGFGEGGVLTEAVRKRPHCVILLDEFEKAHRDVHEVFLQVFDKGFMEDAEGRMVDFRHALILLTTNAGEECILRANAQGEPGDAEALGRDLRAELARSLSEPLLNRLTIIPYHPLGAGDLRSILRLNLGRLKTRLREAHAVELRTEAAVEAWLLERCLRDAGGARRVEAWVSSAILPAISRKLLAGMAAGQPARSVSLEVVNDEIVCRVDA